MATISSRTELTSIDDQDDVIVLDDVSASVTKKMKMGTVLKKMQDGSIVYAADSVGTDSYAVTLSPVPAAYANGMVINFKAATANTGAATLNVNSLGAVTIKKNNDQDLSTNDIEANQIVSVVYNSTGPKFQMQSQLANAGITTDGTETITGGKTFSGDNTFSGANTHTGAELFTGNVIAKLFAPQGFLINGKTSPTVSGDDLTVAIKTLSGGDPSATDPVYCRIGDTVRAITAALSVTAADGTNWFNSGSTELAAKEIDYFVYLGYNSTDGVVIGFSRLPNITQYGDFSATSTNERYCKISTITNAAATDYYENIGRFAATLGASTTYLWTVPTFTASNLIQRPTRETRWLAWAPVWTGFSSSPSGGVTRYRINGSTLYFVLSNVNTGTSNAATMTFTVPMAVGSNQTSNNFFAALGTDNSATVSTPSRWELTGGSAAITVASTFGSGGWISSGGKRTLGNAYYEI